MESSIELKKNSTKLSSSIDQEKQKDTNEQILNIKENEHIFTSRKEVVSSIRHNFYSNKSNIRLKSLNSLIQAATKIDCNNPIETQTIKTNKLKFNNLDLFKSQLNRESCLTSPSSSPVNSIHNSNLNTGLINYLNNSKIFENTTDNTDCFSFKSNQTATQSNKINKLSQLKSSSFKLLSSFTHNNNNINQQKSKNFTSASNSNTITSLPSTETNISKINLQHTLK
jgi:hypothetical protein